MPRTADFKNSATGAIQTRQESISGSGDFDTVVSTPTGRTEGTFGVQPIEGYTPEPVAVYNPQQFGLDLYFSPRYKFSNDWNPNLTKELLRRLGRTAFNFSLSDADKATLSGERLWYITESTLHGAHEGVEIYHMSLQDYFSYVWNSIPQLGSEAAYLVFNVETSNEWYPGNISNGAYAGFDVAGLYGNQFSGDWNALKNQSIYCESDGITRTVEQLANLGQGKWEQEKTVRRTNRFTVCMQIARYRADPLGAKVAWGTSCVQGTPPNVAGTPNYVYGTGVFLDGQADGSHLGANSNGVVNLTIPGGQAFPVTLRGCVYTYETIHWDYDYPGPKLRESDYNEIYLGSDNTKKTHPYIWSKLIPIHVGGHIKARVQGQRYRMTHRSDMHLTPRGDMSELIYEFPCEIVGSDGNSFVRTQELRVADPQLQNSVPIGNGTGGIAYYDTPKLWIPPGWMVTRYAWNRFLEADNDGACSHVFEDKTRFDLATPNASGNTYGKMYQHELHTASSLDYARAALMQPFEAMFEQTNTLIENPEVQLLSTGSFSAYDGADAYNYDGNGTTGTQKPAYSLRYWDRDTYWEVLVIGSHKQASATTSRTDIIRVPGQLNGNTMQVKLRGHWVHLFHFSISKSLTGQLFTATGENLLELAGYSGKIITD